MRFTFIEVRKRITAIGGVIRRESGGYYVSIRFDEDFYPTLQEVIEDCLGTEQ